MADIRVTRNEHHWQQKQYLVEFTVTTANRHQFAVQQAIPQLFLDRHEYELLDLAYLMMGLKLKAGISSRETMKTGTVEVTTDGEPYRPNFFAILDNGSKIHITEDT